MTSEEIERMWTLCIQIQEEKDHEKLSELANQLNTLLENSGHSSMTQRPPSR